MIEDILHEMAVSVRALVGSVLPEIAELQRQVRLLADTVAGIEWHLGRVGDEKMRDKQPGDEM